MRRSSRQPLQVRIRHAIPVDAAALAQVFEGAKAVWGTLQLPFPSEETWRRRLAEPEAGLVMLVACVGGRGDEEIVGVVGLHTHPAQPRRRHAGELGITVRDDRHGRGVGTALLAAALNLADRWMNLTRLELIVWPDNEPALRLYRRHGFVVEGTLKSYGFRDGRLSDALILGRIRGPLAGEVTA